MAKPKKVASAQRDFNVAMTEYDNTKSAASLQDAKAKADEAVKALQDAMPKEIRERIAQTPVRQSKNSY